MIIVNIPYHQNPTLVTPSVLSSSRVLCSDLLNGVCSEPQLTCSVQKVSSSDSKSRENSRSDIFWTVADVFHHHINRRQGVHHFTTPFCQFTTVEIDACLVYCFVDAILHALFYERVLIKTPLLMRL